jgi:hypothetical protein
VTPRQREQIALLHIFYDEGNRGESAAAATFFTPDGCIFEEGVQYPSV